MEVDKYWLKLVVKCLEGKGTEEEKQNLIIQIKKIIKDEENKIRNKSDNRSLRGAASRLIS